MNWSLIETAPRNGQRIIVGAHNANACTAEFRNDRWVLSPLAFDREYLDDVPFEPTHWMSLMAPPVRVRKVEEA